MKRSLFPHDEKRVSEPNYLSLGRFGLEVKKAVQLGPTALLLFVISFSNAYANDLVNGGSVDGAISVSGQTDQWFFTGTAGELVTLTVADTSNELFDPEITVFSPSGVLLSSTSAFQAATLYNVALTETGTYSVSIRDGATNGRTQTGLYRVHLAKSKNTNELGTLIDGGFVSESITLGDLDTWQFEATVGELVTLTVADTSSALFDPEISIYSPDGALFARTNDFHAGIIYNGEITQTGTYVVMVNDGPTNGRSQTGDYQVHFAKSINSNEHGTLVNGGFVTESISIGDTDTWRFVAEPGELVTLTVADISNELFDPELSVYTPDGNLFARTNDFHAGMIYAAEISQAGTYVVMVNDGATNGRSQTGDYQVQFAKSSTANEHGELVNGGFVEESITLGDLDTWVFDATSNQLLTLTVADLSSALFDPEISVFAPDGSLFARTNDFHAGMLYNADISQSGRYVVMINDGATNGRSQGGDYQVHLAKSVNTSEHGEISNASFVEETITLGDLDTWTFDAQAGELATLTVADTSGALFDPQISVYSLDGRLVSTAGGFASGIIFNIDITESGTYVVMVNDGATNGRSQGGTYQVHLAKSIGSNEHGQLFGSGTFDETTTLGDLDTVTFFASEGDQISLRMEDLNLALFDPHLVVYTPDGRYFTQASGFTNATLNDLSLPQTGVYVVLMKDGTTNGSSQSGDYRLHFNLPDLPPDPEEPVAVITAPAQVFKNSTIELNGSASFDPDDSPEPLSFSWQLIDVPQGSTITDVAIDETNPALASLVGDLSGIYRVELTVDDGLLSDSTVAEVTVLNRAPIADAGLDQQANEGDSVELDGFASSDPDGDVITYQWQILSVPAGSSVNQLPGDTLPNPVFVADVDGTFEFSLTVSDGEDSSQEDRVSVTVLPGNLAPQARIELEGDTFEVGETVALNGSNSSDPDQGPAPLSYQWSVISTPAESALTTNDILNRTSVLASLVPDVEGVYVFALRVDDGDLSSDAEIDVNVTQIIVENRPPIADAGEDMTFVLGEEVQLDGSASSDPDLGPEPLGFSWSFTTLPTDSVLGNENIVGSDADLASFLPDVVGTYVIDLLVSDGAESGVDTDSLRVTILPPEPQRCDMDNSSSIDRLDITMIIARRNTPASTEDDPADWDGDGSITVLDIRGCALACDLPRCQTAN